MVVRLRRDAYIGHALVDAYPKAFPVQRSLSVELPEFPDRNAGRMDVPG